MGNKRKVIYEGQGKILYEAPDPENVIQHFKDNINQEEEISGKGILNNRISEYLMTNLGHMGIPNHFIKRLNMREQLVKYVNIIPLRVVVRNIAAGSICTRLGLEEGRILPKPITEYYWKKGNSLLNEDHIYNFGIADPMELEEIRFHALRINDYLSGLFMGIKIRLVDIALEFGRVPYKEYIMLADEITPDNCRLWDRESNERLDKDRFRHNLGQVKEAYQEVAKRLLDKKK